MPNDIQRVVDNIVKVTKGIAAQVGVSFGTVTGRNPDGTLNVDPGNGGCVRVIGPKNARVGDTVPLGTEPALGTLTQLDPFYVPIPPAVVGCPTDPREIPNKPITTALVSGTNIIASAGLTSWDERDTNVGTGSPAVLGNWFGYRKSAAVTSGANLVLAGYREEVVGAAPDEVLYTMDRSFAAVDLTGVNTSGVDSGLITFTVPYSGSSTSGSPLSPHDTTVVILPSTASLPITLADMDKFDRAFVLGSFRMLLNRPAFGGSGTYSVSCALDLSSYEGVFPNPLVLCLMSGLDWSGATPQIIGSLVHNQDIQDRWSFTAGSLTLFKSLL